MLKVLAGLLGTAAICGGVVGCGGGSSSGGSSGATHARASGEPTKTARVTVPASFSGCPQGRQSYVTGNEVVAEARAAIAAGEEVQAAREGVQTGKDMIAQSYELCSSEKELTAAEGNMCKNSPRDLAEALAVEDTRANREYIGVYEVTCDRKVPLP
jgi:hypothetical protein